MTRCGDDLCDFLSNARVGASDDDHFPGEVRNVVDLELRFWREDL